MISIAFVVAAVLGPALIAGCLVLGWWLHRKVARHADDVDRPFAIGFAIVAYLAAGLLFVGFAWGLYPYDMQYHSYRHVTGTVDTVSSRLLGADKSTTQNFAIRLREDGGTYRCDDTRCSLLKRGDRVGLWCIREWQYAATSGWVCNYDRAEGQP